MEEWTEPLIVWLTEYGMKVVAALAIFIIGRIVIGILTGMIRRILTKAGTDETLSKFVISLTRGLLICGVGGPRPTLWRPTNTSLRGVWTIWSKRRGNLLVWQTWIQIT